MVYYISSLHLGPDILYHTIDALNLLYICIITNSLVLESEQIYS
jgi:hypothetical protein